VGNERPHVFGACLTKSKMDVFSGCPMSEDVVPLQYASVPVARELLLRWEKLRLLFNAILIAEVLALIKLLEPRLLEENAFWLKGTVAGLLANICFCLGPYLDLWIHEWRPGQQVSTALLFALELLLSIGVAALCIVGVVMAHFGRGWSFGPMI